MEKKVLSHIYHEHPLFLRKYVNDNSSSDCFRCGEDVENLEMAYICTEQDCSDRAILHKQCGELPNQISHPEHSEHPLNLFYFNKLNDNEYHRCYDRCDFCGDYIQKVFGYRCSSCNFNLHIQCAEESVEERKELQHLSHPSHPLTLIRNPSPLSFYCNGCGDEGKDMAYICSTCEFFLHKSCASLPDTHRTDGHHHSLSLIFSLPKKHRKSRYRCDVCSKYCDASRWAYFCDECRYIVHIKCATAIGSSTSYSNLSEDDRNVIEFPLHVNGISDKLITPFVMREKSVGTTSTSTSTCGGNSSPILLEYYHEHPLSLVSELTHKDDDDEEELKICDVCVTPISNSNEYYECAPCKYCIHHICSLLPHTLQYSSSSSSNPNSHFSECQRNPNKNHNFKLYKSKGRDGAISYWYCDLCGLPTNGMGYECGDCEKKIDVKCASLPTTIRHLSHTRRHHKPLTLTSIPTDDAERKLCHGCNRDFSFNRKAYCCSDDGCDLVFHLECAVVPSSVTNREWDKHPLLLTFDASRDHPSDFFCEFCEKEMHPKNFMYHCRPCDASFHLDCLDTGSGAYRNMKLGGRYEMDGIDHLNHPLTFTCVTLKKRCDLCHEKEYVYTYLGFECASCYHVLCEKCGVRKLIEKIVRHLLRSQNC